LGGGGTTSKTGNTAKINNSAQKFGAGKPGNFMSLAGMNSVENFDNQIAHSNSSLLGAKTPIDRKK